MPRWHPSYAEIAEVATDRPPAGNLHCVRMCQPDSTIKIIDVAHILGSEFVQKPTQTFLPILHNLTSDIFDCCHGPYEKARSPCTQ